MTTIMMTLKKIITMKTTAIMMTITTTITMKNTDNDNDQKHQDNNGGDDGAIANGPHTGIFSVVSQ